MAQKRSPKKRRFVPKIVLRLPDLDQAKAAVLHSLSSADAQRGYRHAIEEWGRLMITSDWNQPEEYSVPHRCAAEALLSSIYAGRVSPHLLPSSSLGPHYDPLLTGICDLLEGARRTVGR